MNVLLHNQQGTQPSAPLSTPTIEQLVQLETLKLLQRMAREQEGQGQGGDSGGTNVRHVRKTLQAYHHMKAMVERQPGKIASRT